MWCMSCSNYNTFMNTVQYFHSTFSLPYWNYSVSYSNEDLQFVGTAGIIKRDTHNCSLYWVYLFYLRIFRATWIKLKSSNSVFLKEFFLYFHHSSAADHLRRTHFILQETSFHWEQYIHQSEEGFFYAYYLYFFPKLV